MRGLDRLPHVEVALAEASVSTTFPPRCRARMGDAQDVVRLVDGTSVTAGTLGALNDSSLAQR